jgi:phosphoribosylaminoimidazole carboxylase (NCAIR synthetase)
MTSPFRKMGHVTITAADAESAIRKADFVKKQLKVVSTEV